MLCLVGTSQIVFAAPTAAPADQTVSKNETYVGQILLEEPQYPLDNYKLETQIPDGGVTGLGNVGDKGMAGINNGLWSLNKQIGDFAIYAVSELLSYDLISQITDKMATISNNVYANMTEVFLSLFLTIAVATAAYRFFLNRNEGGGVKALVGTLLIMVVMFGYFNNTAKVISYINSFSQFIDGKAMSTNVMVSSTQPVDPSKVKDPKEGTALLQNQLFELMILRPYLLLQYGTTDETEINKQDPNRVDTLLSIKPYGDQPTQLRKQIVDHEVNDLGNVPMSPGYEGERLGKILLTIVLTLFITVPVLIMAGMAFLLQIFLICILIFAAIPLCMAVIPSFAPTAGHFFKRVFSLILHKAALTLIISAALGISTLVYNLTSKTTGLNGYMMMAFVVAVIFFGIFKFRMEILHVVTLGSVGAGNVAERITQANSMKQVPGKASEAIGKGKDAIGGLVERMKGGSKKSPARKGYSEGDQQDSNSGKGSSPRFKVVRGGGEGSPSLSQGRTQAGSSQGTEGEKQYTVSNGQNKNTSSQPKRSDAREAAPKTQKQDSSNTSSGEWKTTVLPTYQPYQRRTEPTPQRETESTKQIKIYPTSQREKVTNEAKSPERKSVARSERL